MKKIVFSFALLITMFGVVGCSKVYEGNKSGYVTISDIPGITFDVYADTVKSATAISQINKNSDMSDGNSYLFKNGTTDYILYNSNSLTVVVQKIDSINLKKKKNKEAAINDVTFLGTSVLSKEYEYHTSNKDKAYKLVAQVDAGVSLTLTSFGDYTGQIAYISYQGHDYMMFVGVPKTSYKELNKDVKKAIEHMVKSLKIKKSDFSNNRVESEMGSDTNIEKEENVTTDNTESTDNKTSEGNVSDSSEKNEPVKENNDASSEETNTPGNTDNDIPDTSPEMPDDTKDNENVEDIVVVEKNTENVVNVNNQKEMENNETSIYALGQVGDDIISSGLDKNGSIQGVLVTVTSYYNEDNSINVIKRGVKEDNLYTYFDAPDGCHYEAIEYSVSDSAMEDVYVNFKIVGIDGQALKYKGITYSSRTYDILATTSYKKDGYSNRICYYPVPNGCKEYVLQFGENRGQMGYVKISN